MYGLIFWFVGGFGFSKFKYGFYFFCSILLQNIVEGFGIIEKGYRQVCEYIEYICEYIEYIEDFGYDSLDDKLGSSCFCR